MYVKLFCKILDSSIADDRRLRHFFTDLLLCADGKGYVIMTDGALARRIGASVEEVQWGLAELQKPDPQSHTPAADGRRIERLEGVGYGWRILNYENYRAMKDADQLREATKERVRKHRANKLTCNVTVTKRNGSNAIAEAEGEEDLSEAKASSSAASAADTVGYEEVKKLFHQCCPSLPNLRELPDGRKNAIRSRWKAAKGHALERFGELFRLAEESDFLSGRNGEWPGCSFDWLLKPANAQKVLEGNYKNDRKKAVNPHLPPGSRPPSERTYEDNEL